MDWALAKGDAIAKEFEGSVAAANQAQYDRAKIRTVLGSATMQVLELKQRCELPITALKEPGLAPGFFF